MTLTRRTICLSVLMILAGGILHADDQQAGNNACDGKPLTAADREYQQQAGDVLGPRHLEIARPFSGTGKLTINICDAQLVVRARPDAKDLKISVELGNKSNVPAVDYIHVLKVAPDNGVVLLKFPDDSHAVVTLTVPMKEGLESEFNLGKGNLNFDAIGSAGGRQINVGYGHAKLLVEGDKSYSDMQVNIGMGSLHDHRPGGHDGHFVVSRNYSGTGDGSIQINVGMGSLDIAQE